jgi:hypothetical protein
LVVVVAAAGKENIPLHKMSTVLLGLSLSHHHQHRSSAANLDQ